MYAKPAVVVSSETANGPGEILRPEWVNNIGYFIFCGIFGLILTVGLIWIHEQAYSWFAVDPNKMEAPAPSASGNALLSSLTECQRANGITSLKCANEAKPKPNAVPTPQAVASEPVEPKVVPPETARRIEILFRLAVSLAWLMVGWMVFSQVMRTIYTSWEFLEDVIIYHYRTAGTFWQTSRNEEFRWARIWDKDYIDGPIQRGFQVGDVWLLVRDASDPELQIWGVRDPRAVYDRISVLERSAKQRFSAETNIWGGQEPRWRRHMKKRR